MISNNDLRVAVGVMAAPKANLLAKFLVQLNSTERNNFMKTTDPVEWITAWLRNKHNYNTSQLGNLIKKYANATTFNRYVNSLNRLKNGNMKIHKHMTPSNGGPPFVSLAINNKGYIQLEPVCANNFNKGIYIHYGGTYKGARRQGVGFRLRKTAVNASKNTGIPLWQVSQNVEGLVEHGKLPISGRIMKALGATQIPYAPPCRNSNKRGSYDYAFVVGAPVPKRPIRRNLHGAPKVPRKPRTPRKPRF